LISFSVYILLKAKADHWESLSLFAGSHTIFGCFGLGSHEIFSSKGDRAIYT